MNVSTVKQWVKKKIEDSKEESDYYKNIYLMLSELETFRGEISSVENFSLESSKDICKRCEFSSKNNSFCCIEKEELLLIDVILQYGKPPEGCPFFLEHIMLFERK